MKGLMAVFLSLIFVLIPQLLVQALTWDFENNAQLKDWTVINGKWTIEDGKLKGELLTDYIGVIAGDWEWEDYTLEAETTVVEGKYTYWIVRVQKDELLNYYTFERHHMDGARLYRWDAGQQIELGPDFPLPADHLKSHIWKLEVKGDTITAYLDGKEFASAKDKTYKKGKIGLGGHSMGSTTGKNIILFDYVKVEGPGIPANAVTPLGKLAVAWGFLKVGYY